MGETSGGNFIVSSSLKNLNFKISSSGVVKQFSKYLMGVFILIMLIAINFIPIQFNINFTSTYGEHETEDISEVTHPPSIPRSRQALGFTEISTGLMSSGNFNFLDIADFNSDGNLDIGVTAEDSSSTVAGVLAYAGNGGISWTNTSTGLWKGNSWAGMALADVDSDGYMEFYATDDNSGNSNNSGLKVWEFRNGNWTDSPTHVRSPAPIGRPINVFITNVTGDNKLDIVLCNNSGIRYYQNNGGNPATWTQRSSGLNTSGMFTALAVADMNKDGLKDIVACDYTGNNGEHLFIQSTSGNLWSYYGTTFNLPGTCIGLTVGDVNNDTHMDMLYGSHNNNFGVRCLLGNSGGVSGTSFTWTPANIGLPSNRRYYGLKLVDIDDDSDLDLVAGCSSSSRGMHIYLGNGSTNPGMNMGWTKATNTNLVSNGDWYSVDCEDLNNDGSLDIVAVSYGMGVKAWLNNITPDINPPDVIINLTITNITTNSITVNWTAPADNATNASSGPVQSYDLRYSFINITPSNWFTSIEVTGEPTPALPGTPQGFKITGLMPGTLHYIALRSYDERPNLSPLSNIVFGTTLGIPDTTQPGQIKDLQAINPTNNSINLTWTAPADNGTNISSGSVSQYDIRYYSAQLTNGTWNLATQCTTPIIPSLPGATEIYTVSGLQPEITYYFAIKAADERGNWAWISNSAYNTTLPDPDLIPPATITDLTAVDPTETTINLTWTATGDDGFSGGNATTYDIRYSTLTITAQNWVSATHCTNEPTPKENGTTELFQVTGLTPDTTYYFGIKAVDEKQQWSGLSNIANNKTLQTIDTILPGTITDLAAVDVTSTSVNLTWTAPGDDGTTGTAAGYDIRYATNLITETSWETAINCTNEPQPKSAGSSEWFRVTSLFAATKYYFAIKSYDEIPNYSGLSNIANAITLTSNDVIPPAKIDDLAVVETTETTINLTWTAPGDDGNQGTATVYDLRILETTINSTNWDIATEILSLPKPKPAGEQERFLVTGLDQGTTYYFAIKAGDEVPNWSPISNSPSGTTLGIPIPKLSALLTLEKSQLAPGETTVLSIKTISQLTSQVVSDANVELSSDNPDLVFTPSTGQTNDNGILKSTIEAPEVTRSTTIKIYANVSKAGFKSTIGEVTLTVKPESEPELKFNLYITQEDIILSEDNVKDGDLVTIYAYITNLGPLDSTEFFIQYYIDGLQIGENITMSGLKSEEKTQVFMNWTAKEGEHVIRIIITPVDIELESNINDNMAEKNIQVEGKKTDKSEGDKTEDIINYTWLIIIFIIIVIIILLIFLVFRRRRQESDIAEYKPGYPAQEPPLEPELEGETETVPEVSPEYMEIQVESVEPEPLTSTPHEAGIEGDTVSSEAPGTPEVTITESEPMLLEPANQVEEGYNESPEPVQTDELESVPSKESDLDQSSPPVTLLRQIPCPTCQNLIEIYETPCPHCGTNLNWG